MYKETDSNKLDISTASKLNEFLYHFQARYKHYTSIR